MIAASDFPSLFGADNYALRRTTGHNLYDPESLLTGGEAAAGMSYTNSRRNWPDEQFYLAACTGELSIDQILRVAPRERIYDKPRTGRRVPAKGVVALAQRA